MPPFACDPSGLEGNLGPNEANGSFRWAPGPYYREGDTVRDPRRIVHVPNRSDGYFVDRVQFVRVAGMFAGFAELAALAALLAFLVAPRRWWLAPAAVAVLALGITGGSLGLYWHYGR